MDETCETPALETGGFGAHRRGVFVFVLPTVPPAPGGSSLYAKTIANALAEAGQYVCVVSEKGPGATSLPDWDPRVERQLIFPHRAGRLDKPFYVHLLYAYQNLLFLRLASIIQATVTRAAGVMGINRDTLPCAVFIHSSFFYNRSLMKYAVRMIRRRASGLKLIADVRDPLSTPTAMKAYDAFDAVVACGRAVDVRLRDDMRLREKVRHIPVPFDQPEKPDWRAVSDTMRKHGLLGRRFILNANGISRSKNFDEMLDAVVHLRRREGWRDIILVTVGRRRDWVPSDQIAIDNGCHVYLGLVPHTDLLSLACSAQLGLAISATESLSRATLETLAMGGKVIAPPVPEYIESAPEIVVRGHDPNILADQIADTIEGRTTGNYNFNKHAVSRLIPEYLALLPRD